MYKKFEIKNFKCFKELTFDKLARINLISGSNGAGKTALLEAIYILCGAYDPELFIKTDDLRGGVLKEFSSISSNRTPLDSFFNNFNHDKAVELSGVENEGLTKSLTLRFAAPYLEANRDDDEIDEYIRENADLFSGKAVWFALDSVSFSNGEVNSHTSYIVVSKNEYLTKKVLLPAKPIRFITNNYSSMSADAFGYGELEKNNLHSYIIDSLQIVEPKLSKIANIPTYEGACLYGGVELHQLTPLPLLGGGIMRLLSILISIGNSTGGVVLIDEIEDGFHHSIMVKVWEAIAKTARDFDVQVFATTHSWECIADFYKAFSDANENVFRYHRLDRIRDDVVMKTYSKENLATSIEMNIEMR